MIAAVTEECGELVRKDPSERVTRNNEKEPILAKAREYFIKECLGFITGIKADTVFAAVCSTEIIYNSAN